jgi:hypothetical protein
LLFGLLVVVRCLFVVVVFDVVVLRTLFHVPLDVAVAVAFRCGPLLRCYVVLDYVVWLLRSTLLFLIATFTFVPG